MKQINRKKRIFWSAAVMVILLALDRGSKVFMESWLADKGLVELIPGVIGLRLLTGGNTGAAWGLLSNNTVLLIVLTSLIMIGVLYCLFVKQLRSPWLQTALLLIASGGIGNLYDRIVYGAVTDFFEFLFISFPIFNIADCCVSVGAAVAIGWLVFSKNEAPLFAGGSLKEEKPQEALRDQTGGEQGDGHA